MRAGSARAEIDRGRQPGVVGRSGERAALLPFRLGTVRTVRQQGLAALDDALLRLRRVWSATRQGIVTEGGTPVEMSGLLVVEACARGVRDGREVTIGDVARLADVTPSTASRLVDRAQAAGLLTRAASSVDSRRTALCLTAAGVALQARAIQARRDWLTEQLADWSTTDVAQLGALLHRFADTFFDLPPPGTHVADTGRTAGSAPGDDVDTA